MLVGEKLTPDDMMALALHTISKESIMMSLSKRYGDVYAQTLFSARSNEEKAAILNKIREWQTKKVDDGN